MSIAPSTPAPTSAATPAKPQLVSYIQTAANQDQSRRAYGTLVEHTANKRRMAIYGHSARNTEALVPLEAALAVLNKLTAPSAIRFVCTDYYLVDGWNVWRAGWKESSWTLSDGAPLLHQDLWQQIDALTAKHDIEIVGADQHDPGQDAFPGNQAKAHQIALLALNKADLPAEGDRLDPETV